MLSSLKKALGVNPQEETLEEVQETVTEMNLAGVDPVAKLAEFAGVIEQLTAVVAEKEAALQDVMGKLAGFEQAAKEAEANAEAMRVAAEMAAMEAKKAVLADVIGKDNPTLDALFDSVKGLDAAAFDTVVSSFKAARVAEAQSVMFSEVGVSGEAEAKVEDGESAEMKILKARYKK